MALGGSTIQWDESVPSSSSNAGLGEQDIRSIKTSVRNALDSEHIFSSTGGAATGAHRPGSAVAFFGASSKISSSDTDGRLYIDSTNSRFHHVGSADTMLLGGQYSVLGGGITIQGTTTYSKVTQCFAMEASQYTFFNASTSTTVTLQNTYVNAVAFVQQIPSATAPATAASIFVPGKVSGNQVTVYCSSNGTVTGVSSTTTGLFNLMVVGIKAL